MKKLVGALAITATFSVCVAQIYSYLKKACVQVFDIADIRMDDHANSTLGTVCDSVGRSPTSGSICGGFA